MPQKAPRIVILGGGTGSFTLLQGLKSLTPNLTAVVSMSDDGGSTGVLRDEYGVLPPGDILHIRGQVVPVTLYQHTLVAEDGDRFYYGEHLIDSDIALSKNATLRLEPETQLNPLAHDALCAADLIVIAPGSLYTSLIPILAVTGMRETLARSKARLVSVANLVNKPGQTDGWHVVDYVQQLERYIGTDRITDVLYNTEPISPTLLLRYAKEGELPVDTERTRFAEIAANFHGARLVSKELSARVDGDVLHRTLIRHDATRVADELKKLFAVEY